MKKDRKGNIKPPYRSRGKKPQTSVNIRTQKLINRDERKSTELNEIGKPKWCPVKSAGQNSRPVKSNPLLRILEKISNTLNKNEKA